jgi:hypothetical protein
MRRAQRAAAAGVNGSFALRVESDRSGAMRAPPYKWFRMPGYS